MTNITCEVIGIVTNPCGIIMKHLKSVEFVVFNSKFKVL